MRPVDPARAYERLDQILVREEYQGYVSPFSWLVKSFEWFSRWFEGLGLPFQIIFLVVLIGILVAILVHFVLVLFRVLRTSRGQKRPSHEFVTKVSDLPASRDLVERARKALDGGDRSAALRLFYLAILARLRERGRIPLSTALTGREILAATRPPLAGLVEATGLFESCVYGAIEPATEEVGTVRRLSEEVA